MSEIFPTFYLGEIIDKYPKTSLIYSFVNTINLKRYIGQTDNFQRRTMQHLRDLRAERDLCRALQNSWNKYGEEYFYIEILEFCEVNELDSKETFYINKFNTTNKEFGYNIFGGGRSKRDGGHPLKGKKFNEEELKKRKESSLKGESHPFYGKKRPPEVHIKVWETRKGFKHSEESKNKMRESSKKRGKMSEETKNRISNSNKGKKMNPESVKMATISKVGKIKKNSKNRFPGITYEKSSGRWVSQMEQNGKSKKIGRFDTDVDAFIAYVEECVVIYGEEILNNFKEYFIQLENEKND